MGFAKGGDDPGLVGGRSRSRGKRRTLQHVYAASNAPGQGAEVIPSLEHQGQRPIGVFVGHVAHHAA